MLWEIFNCDEKEINSSMARWLDLDQNERNISKGKTFIFDKHSIGVNNTFNSRLKLNKIL